uniref:Wsv115 n=1 Tax=White spot syndrome virus TaxID=342409 RepID=A0A8E7C1K8_9VIRU|nr:MAG: hypothetical protein EDAONDGI_00133 [White spot syndrome virus]
MATFTEQDHKNAFLYANEKLRQERIYRLKMSEPSVYAFIDIKEIENGWEKEFGLLVQPGQKLAPFRDISYDSSKLDCDAFSCIPSDILHSDNEKRVGECNFAEHTSVSFPVKNPEGKTLRHFTACGPGCYRRYKQRDPHTGLPVARGVLMQDHVDHETGNKMCEYLNQSLVMWAAVPWIRPGDLTEGYNTTHVPGFAFKEDDERDSKRVKYENVVISKAYCDFFKQYYDADSGSCYRSGWMKFVHLMFGQYFTNLSYNLANPKPYNLTGNTWSDVVSVLTDNPIVDAGAAPSRSEMDEIITKKKFNVFPSEQTSARQKAENIIRSQYGDGVEIDPSSVDALMQFVNREGVVGTEKKSDRLMRVADAVMDAAMRLQVMGLDDSQSRRLLLKNMIKMSRNNPEYARHFSSSLKLIGVTLAIKRSVFSKGASAKRKETAINNGEQHRRSRWSPETVTEEDALLFARENITEDPKHPAPFVDILHSPDINSSIKSGSSSSIWNDILSRISSTRKLEEKASVFVKNLVVKVVRQFLDILEGKLFSDGYEWDDNIPLMIGVDQILREVIKAASNMCARFASSALESSLVTGFMDSASAITSRLAVQLAARTFSVFLEESVIEFVVAASLRLAIQAFADLATLAASALTVIGIVIFVIQVLGLILDLALGLGWYDHIFSPEDLKKQVLVFRREFAKAGNVDVGVAQPVTPEEIVAINVFLQTEENGEEKKEEGARKSKIDFLQKYFHSTPLMGKKSKFVYIQEAAQEYLGGRTMNAFGQRIITAADDSDTTTTTQEGRRDDETVTKKMRSIILETGQTLKDYSSAVNYNASRLDYVGEEWVRNTALKEETRSNTTSDNLFKKTVSLASMAGAFLVLGIGVLVASHITLLRFTNIGLAFAFAGLLAFIALMSISYINMNAMGVVNSDAIYRSTALVGDIKTDPRRVGMVQRHVGVGAKYNMITDFVSPMLDEIESD